MYLASTLSAFLILLTLSNVGWASIEPVPFHKVEMTSEFWRPRLITQRKVLVPFAFEKTESGVAHLQAAADFLAGKKVEGLPSIERETQTALSL